jgi:hypothetical protein
VCLTQRHDSGQYLSVTGQYILSLPCRRSEYSLMHNIMKSAYGA